jgi:integrase
MALYPRHDSRYWWMTLEGVVTPDGKQLRESTRIPRDAPTKDLQAENRAKAERLYHQRMLEVTTTRVDPEPTPPPTTITLNAWLDWWEQHKLPRRSKRTREREVGILPRLREAFGTLPLDQIKPKMVDEWITIRLELPTRVPQGTKRKTFRIVWAGPATVNREVACLKHILQDAVAADHLEQSPLYGMKKLDTPAVTRRVLSYDEEERLLAQLAPLDRPIVIMGLDGLCRLSDILNLRRDDDRGHELYIRHPKNPKQKKGYTVSVSKRLRKALDAMPVQGPYYFAHRRVAKNPEHWRSGIAQMIETACKYADPPIPYGRKHDGITFHWGTRRTGASRMLAGGTSIKTVQRIGNWATAALPLDIYAEVVDDEMRDAVEIPGRRRRRVTRGDR